FVMLLCHNEILLQYDISIISCIVYLEFSHFDLHYLYTSTRGYKVQKSLSLRSICMKEKMPGQRSGNILRI
ncbi:hypothetical protein B5G11_06900, partial [Drancourtella sp. An57]